MSKYTFKFKQFIIEQDRCSMKIGSDAVLMGSLLNLPQDARQALEIGTGSGVISLMLAQKFSHLQINAIELDQNSAEQASENFNNSIFKDRLQVQHVDFLNIDAHQKYDVIFSNPPYFYHSLKNENEQKSIARHISWVLFTAWLNKMNELSHDYTQISLILPQEAFEKTNKYLSELGFHLVDDCAIKSFKESETIRKLSIWTKNNINLKQTSFVIYQAEKVHSSEYINALKDFLIIF